MGFSTCTYKSDNIFTVTSPLDHCNWSYCKAQTEHFDPLVSYANYRICIFMNFNENIKNG